MKKNAIAHMVAEKEPVGKRISRYHPVSRLLCLLLALLIWLAVANINGSQKENDGTGTGESETRNETQNS